MYKRLNNLGFVIGIFFTIISLIILIGWLLSDSLRNKLNLYSGLCFLVFGLFMTLFNLKVEE